jgi:hypothetical protein
VGLAWVLKSRAEREARRKELEIRWEDEKEGEGKGEIKGVKGGKGKGDF